MPSALVGAPRQGARPTGAGAASGERFVRAWRRSALAGGLATLWGAAGLLLFVALLAGPVPVVLGALALAATGAALLVAARPVGGALLTLALAGAAAAHVAFWGGVFAFAFPFAAWPAFVAAVLVAPFLLGWRAHALDLAARTTGRLPRALPLRALATERPEDLLPPAPAHVASALARRYAEGWAAPGILLADLLLPRGRRLRLDASVDDLADALTAAGAACERLGDRLEARLVDGPPATLRPVRLLFPTGARATEVRGGDAASARLSALLEADASHAGLACWTRQGRRWEARLNAGLRDAARATTLEERSLLLEDAQRIASAIESRDLMEDERAVLRAKALRLRFALANKLLSEPVGPRTEGRVVAPAPAIAPSLDRVLDGGGLATLRRAVFVPHWIVPVRTGWGEHEALVNALTLKPVADAGRALLAQPPERFLALPKGVTFLPAPEPTAALLRELRDAMPDVDVAPAAASPPDLLYVPFLPTEQGYVDAVTGARSEDLGSPAAVSVPA